MNVYLLAEHVCGYETVICIATTTEICKREAEEHRKAKPYIDEHYPMKWYDGTLTKSYDLYTDHDYYHIYQWSVTET